MTVFDDSSFLSFIRTRRFYIRDNLQLLAKNPPAEILPHFEIIHTRRNQMVFGRKINLEFNLIGVCLRSLISLKKSKGILGENSVSSGHKDLDLFLFLIQPLHDITQIITLDDEPVQRGGT